MLHNKYNYMRRVARDIQSNFVNSGIKKKNNANLVTYALNALGPSVDNENKFN